MDRSKDRSIIGYQVVVIVWSLQRDDHLQVNITDQRLDINVVLGVLKYKHKINQNIEHD